MRQRRAFVLISVLIFILVSGMLARAMLGAGVGLARVGVHSEDELVAQRAAEAGASYARAQLKEKSDWQGDLNTTTVNRPDLRVVEDNGNVIGWIRDATGRVSMFRIRFNYQDGNGTSLPGDMLNDPSPSHRVDHGYISINNVRGGSDVPVPVAAPPGWAVTDPAQGPSTAPRGTAVVQIEGLSGAAVQAATGPDSAFGNGFLMRRVLRVVYAASADPGIPDAALSAGNGIRLETSERARVSVIGQGTARLRSKKEVAVEKYDNSSAILTMDGDIGRDSLAGGLTGTPDGSIVERDESVGDGNDFHNLSWSDVPLASSDANTTVQIPGGVYVTEPTSGDILYYDMKLDDYKALTPDASGIRPGGTVLNANFDQVRSPGNRGVSGLEYKKNTRELEFTRDVNVATSSNGVDDIVFTPLSGRQLHQEDTEAKYLMVSGSDYSQFYSPGTIKMNNSVFSSKGDMAVLINVSGQNAAITAEGDAVVAAPSVSLTQLGVSGFQQRLSIYAKGDLQVSTFIDAPGFDLGIYGYLPPYQGYAPLKLEGLIYSWGDATIYSGTPGRAATVGQFGTTPSNYGNVTIQGALVAYGAEPGVGTPGSDGKGRVSVFSEFSDIIYDATKLVADPTALPEAGLPSVTRVSYGFQSPK